MDAPKSWKNQSIVICHRRRIKKSASENEVVVCERVLAVI